ncbi:transcription termination factor 3, mitochondrial [Engraulis encrasicolus]|uniref:transcription termination factor 3, mitochondrial n=1 Tax=Engraulis encrasicolus TaxID=184585 RepID=UPI002FD1A900
MYCCQRCIRMLLGNVSVHPPRNGVTLPQQHLSIHTTTRKNVLSSHFILHGGRIQPRIPLVRSRVGTLQGLCDSAAVKISHQIKPSDNDDTLARNIVPYEQAQTTSRKPHLTEIPALLELEGEPRLSPLEEISNEEAVQIIVPHALPPSSNSLRAYVDQSETLSKLVQLGVDLWRLEQRRNVGSMLVRLDFEADVAPRLLFLNDLGVQDHQLGHIITTNPFILTEDLDNLKARVSYLKSKMFSAESVASMVQKAPYLLNFSVKRLDNRLGFYQESLALNPAKTRDLITRLPRLLCGSLEPVKENLKVYELQFGFRKGEIQHMVTKVPKLLTANKTKLTKIFDYMHNTMGIPQHLISKFPQVLNSSFLRMKERHLFLKYLGRAQYNPAEPNYISLDRLVTLPDGEFCASVALATVEDFECFQKTL